MHITVENTNLNFIKYKAIKAFIAEYKKSNFVNKDNYAN